jgi:hypothetical protein
MKNLTTNFEVLPRWPNVPGCQSHRVRLGGSDRDAMLLVAEFDPDGETFLSGNGYEKMRYQADIQPGSIDTEDILRIVESHTEGLADTARSVLDRYQTSLLVLTKPIYKPSREIARKLDDNPRLRDFISESPAPNISTTLAYGLGARSVAIAGIDGERIDLGTGYHSSGEWQELQEVHDFLAQEAVDALAQTLQKESRVDMLQC